jgi:hypothetical protein
MEKKQRIKKPEGQAEQWQAPKKRMKGEGVFYEEPKSETAKLSLTPTGKDTLKQLAAVNKLSMSEFLERWLANKTEGLILPDQLINHSQLTTTNSQ